MCHHVISITHFSCGHTERKNENSVDCRLTSCRISPSHKREPHQCQGVCRQQMQPPQEIHRAVPQRCKKC